jgi:hypothetical protein
MSEVIMYLPCEVEATTYTYVNADLEVEFPLPIETTGFVCPTQPLVPRSREERAKVKKHPLFDTD